MTTSNDPFVSLIAPDPSAGAEPSLADLLAFSRDALTPALLDDGGAAAAEHLLRNIPAWMAPFWGLETRLASPEARMDALWEIRRGTPGNDLLAGRADTSTFASPCPPIEWLIDQAPVWQALRRFAQTWHAEAAAPHGLIRNIWMEADTARWTAAADLDANLAAPCLFWGSNRDSPDAGGPPSDRELLPHLPELADATFGVQIDRAALDRVARALPPEAIVFQHAAMAGREVPVARLCVRAMDAAGLESWLRAIGWPGCVDTAVALFEWLAPQLDSIALNIDIAKGGVGPKLGFELYQSFEPMDPSVWDPVFAWLQARGLARADKLAALRGFPSHLRFAKGHPWRDDNGLRYATLTRNIHHLKITMVDDRIEEAKGYVALFRPGVNHGELIEGPGESGGDPWLFV